MRFSKVRQLLVDFQLIPSPSLDFQVGLNLDETAPLSADVQRKCYRLSHRTQRQDTQTQDGGQVTLRLLMLAPAFLLAVFTREANASASQVQQGAGAFALHV